MWIGYLILLIIKIFIGFVGLMQIVRLTIAPGFAQMITEGKILGKNVLLNNFLLLVGCCVVFYIMSKLGINILDNK